VFTKKLKLPEESNTLIFKLIEQYFSPSYKPTNNFVFRAAVTYFFDNTLGLPAGTNNTQPSINNMTKWDVSAVSSFDAVFATRSDFNENIGAWDVSLVTTFSVAFSDCFKFNQPIGNGLCQK
jgi:hypothetical protein